VLKNYLEEQKKIATHSFQDEGKLGGPVNCEGQKTQYVTKVFSMVLFPKDTCKVQVVFLFKTLISILHES